jgi:HAD superfamily hydrolase (TIGR01509 family)
VIRGVVFDLDGVLLDSEPVWDGARRDVAERHGASWGDDATAATQGMSSIEWSRYMHDRAGVELEPGEIVDLVVAAVLERYDRGLPVLPGALDAVDRLSRRWPLALASSANRVVIDRVLREAGLEHGFVATVSSEEVPRGKPAPDVYLAAARLLGQPPTQCAAVEDSVNGIRAALAAGMAVVAVPGAATRPADDVLAQACLVVDGLEDITVEAVEDLFTGDDPVEARLDEVERESFPASDPHTDWAGPPG